MGIRNNTASWVARVRGAAMTFLTASVPSMVGWDEGGAGPKCLQQLDVQCFINNALLEAASVEESRMWSQHCGARNELSAPGQSLPDKKSYRWIRWGPKGRPNRFEHTNETLTF